MLPKHLEQSFDIGFVVVQVRRDAYDAAADAGVHPRRRKAGTERRKRLATHTDADHVSHAFSDRHLERAKLTCLIDYEGCVCKIL
jgi:hypothetical protein